MFSHIHHAPTPHFRLFTLTSGSPKTVAAALKDVRAVFIVSPGAENMVKLVADGVAAVKAAGITTIVVVSVIDVPTGLFKAQFTELEGSVKTSGLDYTLLRLPIFFENQWSYLGSIKDESKIYSPNDPAKPMSLVTVADIGAASAAVLAASAAHANKTYDLISDSVDFNAIVAGFTAAVGRKIEYVHIPYDVAIEGIVGDGVPRWQAVALTELFELVDSRNYNPAVTVGTSDLESIIGRTPTTFKAWVDSVAPAFKTE